MEQEKWYRFGKYAIRVDAVQAVDANDLDNVVIYIPGGTINVKGDDAQEFIKGFREEHGG